MEIFEGSPRDKFYEIVFGASTQSVANTLDKLFEKVVALQALAKDIKEQDINAFLADNQDALAQGLNDIYIGMSAEILSQNE